MKYLNKCTHGASRKSSGNPVQLKSFRVKSVQSFRDVLRTHWKIHFSSLNWKKRPNARVWLGPKYLLCCSCAIIADFEQI